MVPHPARHVPPRHAAPVLDAVLTATVPVPARRNFEVEVEALGAKRTLPLIPGGSSTPVTGRNVAQYVEALVQWTLNDSVKAQFGALSYGFLQVSIMTT